MGKGSNLLQVRMTGDGIKGHGNQSEKGAQDFLEKNARKRASHHCYYSSRDGGKRGAAKLVDRREELSGTDHDNTGQKNLPKLYGPSDG